jgi:putative component of toxin-antitoxin plasmid stabilization module
MSGYDVFTYFNSKFKDKTAKINTISRMSRLVLQRNPELKKPIEQIKTAFKIKNID